MQQAQRFAEVKALFGEVYDLVEPERTRRLHEITTDHGVISQVLDLIRESERKDATFARPVLRAIDALLETPVTPGDTIGVWRVIREIGQGGMGSVHLVERSDGHFKQTAALKLLKGLPRAEGLAYFTRERQLLATLTHPNIARLLDGGATQDGQPYLVMEFIDGVAIDAHCRAKALRQKDTLRLFISACDAVAFAHRQLIVHCDLKPSNLLVNQEGRPVLLDFGIAKLTDAVGADQAVEGIAAPVKGAFTPRYASPEQVAQGKVTTASDIYSLGVMLGELLAGGSGASIADPELGAVVAKATHADPALRYATVDALTTDVDRYLNGHPLEAVPATTAYRTRKFIRRRWPLLAVAAAFVAMAGGFTMRVIAESQRARLAESAATEQRDRAASAERAARVDRDRASAAEGQAIQDRDLAQAAEGRAIVARDQATAARDRATRADAASRRTSDFLVSIFQSSDPTGEAGDPKASRLIALAEQRLDKDLASQPETQADLLGTIAEVQTNMGNPQAARKDLEKAIAIERSLNRPAALATLLWQYSNLLVSNFGTVEAEAPAREALLLRERTASPGSPEIASAYARLGHILSTNGKYGEAETLMLRGLALRQRIGDEKALQDSWNTLAQHYSRMARVPEADAAFHKAIDASSRLFRPNDPVHLFNLEMYGRFLVANHLRLDEAERVFREALARRREVHGDTSDLVAADLSELARVLQNVDRPMEAFPLYEEALSIREKQTGKHSTGYAVLLNNIATARLTTGNYEAGEKSIRAALTIFEKALDPSTLVLYLVRLNLARILMRAGQFDEAKRLLVEIDRVRSERLGEKNRETIESRLVLAELFVRIGSPAEAAAVLEKVRPYLPTPVPRDLAFYERARGLLAAAEGRPEEAIASFERAEKLWKDAGSDRDAALIAIERAAVIARSSDPSDRARAAALATEIEKRLGLTIDPVSPILARLRAIQAGRP